MLALPSTTPEDNAVFHSTCPRVVIRWRWCVCVCESGGVVCVTGALPYNPKCNQLNQCAKAKLRTLLVHVHLLDPPHTVF